MANRGEIKKRSVVISGHATSFSIETEFRDLLKDIATRRGVSINYLLSKIDRGRTNNLSSAARIYVLKHVMSVDQKLND